MKPAQYTDQNLYWVLQSKRFNLGLCVIHDLSRPREMVRECRLLEQEFQRRLKAGLVIPLSWDLYPLWRDEPDKVQTRKVV
jgi:hypothetical protein